jgi:cell division protein FtsQ
MKPINKSKFKKIVSLTVWILLGLSTIALLVSAIYIKETKKCTGISIQILGVSNNFFIDKNDVQEIIKNTVGNKINGKPIREFDLNKIEKELKKDVWISKADLYFDRNGILKAEILEKEPIARVFSNDGNSFYIDDSINRLPLSNKHAARLPVFTNFSTSLKVMTKADSNLLRGIKQMSLYIQKDSFLMAMIDQVYIIGQDQYELIPKMGDQIVLFGDEKNMEKKFEKFKLFYKKIVPQYGWSKYSKIKLDYENQIVATVRGKEDVVADSLRTMAMMRAMAEYNLRMAGDTTQTILQDNATNTTSDSLIFISFERDDLEESSVALSETKSTIASNSLKLDSVKKISSVVKKETKIKAESKTTSKKEAPPKKQEKKATIKNQTKSKSTPKNKTTPKNKSTKKKKK